MTIKYRTAATTLSLAMVLFASAGGSAFAFDASQSNKGFTATYTKAAPDRSFAENNRELNGAPCGIECNVEARMPLLQHRAESSGTRGRLGLGAAPAAPEGPGNFSD